MNDAGQSTRRWFFGAAAVGAGCIPDAARAIEAASMAENVRIPPFLQAPSTVVGGTPRQAFPFSFPFFAPADIIVLVDGVALAPSAFTVTGYYLQDGQPIVGGFGSGQVVLDAAVSNATVTIDRFVVGDRETQFSRSAPVGMPALNGDLNRLTARHQDLARRQAAFDALGLDAAEIAADREATEEALNLAQQYAADAAQVSGVNVPIYASRASLEGATVAVGVLSVETQGYASAGDGGGARWKRADSEPAHPGKVASNGGTVWWEYVPGAEGVSPRQFGAVLGPGYEDLPDSADAMNDAAEVCRVLREQLTLREFLYLRIEAEVDLTGLRMIDLQSPIYADPAIPGIPLTVGGYSADGTSMVYRLPRIDDGSPMFDGSLPSRPLLRIVGVKGAEIHYGDCQYIQFYASAGDGASFSSTGYLNLHPTGLQKLLEFTDDGLGDGATTGWVNEINVWGGRYFRLRVDGALYGHNRLRFHAPCIEGVHSEITFKNCSSCEVRAVRGEGMAGSAGVSFDAQTVSNRVTFDWIGTGTPEDDFRIPAPVSDLGKGNLVTTEAAIAHETVSLFSLTAGSGLLSTATDTTAPDARISPNEFGFVAEFGLGRAVLDPGLSDFGFAADKILVASDRTPVSLGQVFRWKLDFDGALLRPYVVVYGADGKPLTSEAGGGAYVAFLNMGTLSATHGAYGTGSNLTAAELNAAPIVIMRSEVKAVRIALSSGSAGRARKLAALTFLDPLTDTGVAQVSPRLLTLDGPPTRGFAPARTVVRNRAANTFLDNDLEHETTVAGALSAGATSVTVTTIGTVANGDIVGLVMDNGAVHWASVSGLAGSTFTIAAVPVGRSIPNLARAVFNRWA